MIPANTRFLRPPLPAGPSPEEAKRLAPTKRGQIVHWTTSEIAILRAYWPWYGRQMAHLLPRHTLGAVANMAALEGININGRRHKKRKQRQP